jgi:hypothetical protein
MNCNQARDAMLVAELAELRSRETSTPLSAHLAECAVCRRRAASIANQTAGVAALVRRRVDTNRVRPVRRFVFIASLPIAAGLIIAVALTARQRPAVVREAASSSRPVVRNVSVDVTPGQQTTVLKTADSTVTIVWLTPGVGQ